MRSDRADAVGIRPVKEQAALAKAGGAAALCKREAALRGQQRSRGRERKEEGDALLGR